MSQIEIESTSAEMTKAIGRRLGEVVEAGTIIRLDGDLGTGKTVFTKGLAEGLGITEPVSSPTFTIVQYYEQGRLPLYHFDVYRIADPEEMDEIGYEDCFFGQGVSLVEWASLIEELMPENVSGVKIEKDPKKGFDYRKITLIGKIAELYAE